jgi:hypothetical protein
MEKTRSSVPVAEMGPLLYGIRMTSSRVEWCAFHSKRFGVLLSTRSVSRYRCLVCMYDLIDYVYGAGLIRHVGQ